MARRAPLTWRVATLAGSQPETSSATTLILDVQGWPGQLAGQHVDVQMQPAAGLLGHLVQGQGDVDNLTLFSREVLPRLAELG